MNINKVVIITIGYMVLNGFIFILNYTTINSPLSLGVSPRFNFINYFLTSLLIGLTAGVLGGALLVWVNNKLFNRLSFKLAMLTTLLAYILIFLLVSLVAWMIMLIGEYGPLGISLDILKTTLEFVLNPTLVVNFFLWGIISLLTLFLLQVNDKFGPGILIKFLSGNYYQPKKEKRIFMFMDMRSSTNIAEKIGNYKYFNLLRDVYADITNTILNYEGEIYQYVGDEIVISWSVQKGVRHENYLRCFIAIQKKLIELGSIYKEKYGIIPEFKAGVHYGFVIAGEIGVIKKDIIYSGDVLNTTARIQELCNHYNVDILLSKDVFDLISKNKNYEIKPLKFIELRGKKRKINLVTII
jgi:adenylate cyclase